MLIRITYSDGHFGWRKVSNNTSALGRVHEVDDKLVEMWEATELLVNAQQLQLQQLDNEEHGVG